MEDQSHIDLVETYFDANARSWSDFYEARGGSTNFVLADRRDMALDFLAERAPEGGHALDAGCGAGPVARALVSRGYSVHGVDISQEMVDLCWASFAESGIDPSSYSFARGELLGDDLGGPYDGILALGVLQYQDDEDALLRHFKSLLKPGGALVITGPIKARLSDVFGLSSAHRRWREGRAQSVSADRQLLFQISVNDYSKARLSRLLEDAGFEVLRCRVHGYTNLAVINRWRSLDLAAHRLLSGLASVLPIDGWANDLVALAALPRP